MSPVIWCMLAFVLLVSVAVFFYARHYMNSDLHRYRFLAKLMGVSLSVICLILANNLVLAFVGWQGISFFIYHLLTHYKHRPQAIPPAKHKYWVTSIGNLCFLIAIVIAYMTVHSTEYAQLASSSGSAWIAFLLVIAVMTKASLFPFHRWLPNTLETPTPVSALMHAGVINAGGFLMIRLLPLMEQHVGALALLAAAGVITVVIGSLYSLIQPSIKKKLAYSTVSQMGFMFFQYGVGSPFSALFHLFSHGLYKATAFLDSGNGLMMNRWVPQQSRFLDRLQQTLMSILLVALILWVSRIGYSSKGNALFTYGFVGISIFQWMKSAFARSGYHVLTHGILAVLLTLEYMWLTHEMMHLFSFPALNWLSHSIQMGIIIMVWTIQILISLLPIQTLQHTSLVKKLYRSMEEHHYA